MKHFDVLATETEILGPHFLEASAGTGKTFAIQHIVSRLILEKHIPIGHILIVTFTRAATHELSTRIRSHLQNLLAIFKERRIDAAPDYVMALFEKGEVRIKEALRSVEEALICFESAQIFTIHGFCHRMLSEYAFEAKLGFEVTDPNAQDYQSALRAVILDSLLCDLDASKISPRQLDKVLKKHSYQMENLSERIARLIQASKPVASNCLDFSELYERFCDQIYRMPPIEADKVQQDILLLSPHYKKMSGERLKAQITALAQILEKKTCTEQEFDALLKEKEWFLAYFRPDNLKVRAKLPPVTALYYPGLLETLHQVLLPLLSVASDPSSIFLYLTKRCEQRWRTHFQEAELFSPDDLLKKMEEALSSSSFVQSVRCKFRAVFIDEFQDTDPRQWTIFRHLFVESEVYRNNLKNWEFDKETFQNFSSASEHENFEEQSTRSKTNSSGYCGIEAFYLVGDPKQSIYGFRNADIYTYLEAGETLGEKARSYLSTNYRSHPELVKALNLLFSEKSAPGWMVLPKKNKALNVPAVGFHEKGDPLIQDGKGTVHFWVLEDACKYQKTWPSKEVESELLFPLLAQEIEQLKKMQNVPYRDIVILIKDRFQGARLAEFLKQYQIPYVLKRNTSLADSPVFALMKELMEAVENPEDVRKLKQVVAGLLIGWNAEDMQQKEKMEQAVVAFQQLQETLIKRGFGAFFHEFWTSLYSGALSSECLQLAEVLMERTLLFPPMGYAAYFEELLLSGQDDLKMRAEAEGVVLMTTHLSKGLEFDVVFALGLASRHTSTDEEEDTSERDAEKMRQLYVGLTRAKRRVYLPLVLDKEKRPIDLGNSSALELFCARLVPDLNKQALCELIDVFGKEVAITWSDAEKNMKMFVSEQPPSPQAEPKLVHKGSPFGIRQYIRSFSTFADPVKTFIVRKAPSSRLPSSAETGTRIHHILEKVIARRLVEPFREEKVRSLIREQQFGQWEEEVYQMVHGAFHVPLLVENETFILRDVPAKQMLQEMEFLFPDDSSFIKGFADLMFKWKDKYYLLDWKTNDLGNEASDYEPAQLKKVMADHDYYLQAAIYTEALKRYVKLFDKRPFEEVFGGVFYVFLRGKAALHFFPKAIACLKNDE